MQIGPDLAMQRIIRVWPKVLFNTHDELVARLEEIQVPATTTLLRPASISAYAKLTPLVRT